MTGPICRVHVNTVMCGQPMPCEEHNPTERMFYHNASPWLRNVLEHCDRATSTSLATMRALGKDSTKIRKAVGQ